MALSTNRTVLNRVQKWPNYIFVKNHKQKHFWKSYAGKPCLHPSDVLSYIRWQMVSCARCLRWEICYCNILCWMNFLVFPQTEIASTEWGSGLSCKRVSESLAQPSRPALSSLAQCPDDCPRPLSQPSLDQPRPAICRITIYDMSFVIYKT